MSGRKGGIPGRRWKYTEPCGTPAAYRRHLRHGEAACTWCLAAERARQRGTRQLRMPQGAAA